MPNFGWNYPPGVTGMEPEITGDWPCDCGDQCEKVGTDCCDDQYECETVVGGGWGVSDDESIRVCRAGFGCATKPERHLQAEAEGLNLIAREKHETTEEG